jgi:hypothetical protein
MQLPPDVERKALELAGAAPAHPSEREFMADVLAFARGLGYLAYHTHDSRRSAPGFPDAVLSRGRTLIVAEFKVGTNRLTPEQADWLERFRAAGVRAFEWRPEDWPGIESVLRGG